MFNLALRACVQIQARRPLSVRYSSGSSTAGNVSPEQFIKTGEKAQDPTAFGVRSNEYSQSGGDDMVAGQGSASFQDAQNTDPQSEKAMAGRGNTVNPLEFSAATTELSRHFEDKEVTHSEAREAGAATGQGVTRKSKTVKKTELDFKPGR